MDKGIWKDTYAATNDKEYWAEGVQAYFDCAAPPQPGNHNDINTREKLEKSRPGIVRPDRRRFQAEQVALRPLRQAARPGGPGPEQSAPGGTAADYERAAKLHGLTQDKVFKAAVAAHWFADGDRFWYRNDLAGGDREFILVDAFKGERKAAFDAESWRRRCRRLRARNSRRTGCRSTTSLRGSRRSVLIKSAANVEVRPGGLYIDGGEIPEKAPPAPPAGEKAEGEAPRRRARGPESPDGKWTAFVKDFNLYFREKETGKEFPLSQDGKAGRRLYRRGVLVARRQEADRTPDEEGRRAEGLPDRVVAAGSGAAEIVLLRVPQAGRPRARRQAAPVRRGREKGNPRRRRTVFEPRSSRIPLGARLQPFRIPLQPARPSGASRRRRGRPDRRGEPVIDEQSKTFIDYSGKKYDRYLDATDEILWMSERDGWNHLYLYDAKTGKVKNQVTKGEWVVRGVDRVDEKKRQVWFHAGGVYPNQDPYYIHYCRVNFDGTGLTLLTEGDGTHKVEFSPDGRFLIDTYSAWTCRRSPSCGAWRTASACAAGAGRHGRPAGDRLEAAGAFVAKGRDGKTDIYGVIFRPMDLDPPRNIPSSRTSTPGRKIPTFRSGFRRITTSRGWPNWASSWCRSTAWARRTAPRRFTTFAGRTRRRRAAGSHRLDEGGRGEVPLSGSHRVGVYGASAGGQNSLGRCLSTRTSTRSAWRPAAATITAWTRSGGTSSGWAGRSAREYAEQSNVTNAPKLQGKLLLIVGEMDHNVDPHRPCRWSTRSSRRARTSTCWWSRRRPRHGRRLRRTADARLLRALSARRGAARPQRRRQLRRRGSPIRAVIVASPPTRRPPRDPSCQASAPHRFSPSLFFLLLAASRSPGQAFVEHICAAGGRAQQNDARHLHRRAPGPSHRPMDILAGGQGAGRDLRRRRRGPGRLRRDGGRRRSRRHLSHARGDGRRMSNVHLFLIDDLPVRPAPTAEKGPFKVRLPAALSGAFREAHVDRFAIDVAAGRRGFSFEAVGNRLGTDADPLVTVRDAGGRIVAQHDNDPGLYFDCRFEHVFKDAGTYTVEVRDPRFHQLGELAIRPAHGPLPGGAGRHCRRRYGRANIWTCVYRKWTRRSVSTRRPTCQRGRSSPHRVGPATRDRRGFRWRRPTPT